MGFWGFGAETNIQVKHINFLNLKSLTSSYVKTSLFLSVSGMVLSTARNLGLQVNLAFLSVTTWVEMLAVWIRRWVADTETTRQL